MPSTIALDDDHALDGRRAGPATSSTRSANWGSVTTTRHSRVAEQVLDLLRRGGVVDRERNRSEVHRGGVDDHRLRPVGQHHRDACRRAHTRGRKALGDRPHAARILAPRELARRRHASSAPVARREQPRSAGRPRKESGASSDRPRSAITPVVTRSTSAAYPWRAVGRPSHMPPPRSAAPDAAATLPERPSRRAL